MGEGTTWVAIALAVGALWVAGAVRRRALRAEIEARRLSKRLTYTEGYVAWLDRELTALKSSASKAMPRSESVVTEPTGEPAPSPESSTAHEPPAQAKLRSALAGPNLDRDASASRAPRPDRSPRSTRQRKTVTLARRRNHRQCRLGPARAATHIARGNG
jgi:hypothetical protein